MSQIATHNKMPYGANHQPIVLQKEKDAFQFWLIVNHSLPKTERFSLGQKISELFLIILKSTYASAYLPPEIKIESLAEIILKHDELKFFIQLIWEMKLIPTAKYAELADRLVKIGQMLGGWKKDLVRKTPVKPTGEIEEFPEPRSGEKTQRPLFQL